MIDTLFVYSCAQTTKKMSSVQLMATSGTVKDLVFFVDCADKAETLAKVARYKLVIQDGLQYKDNWMIQVEMMAGEI